MKKTASISAVLLGLIPSLLQAATPEAHQRVKSITFIGNEGVSSERLKAQLLTKEGGPLGPKSFERDVQRLNYLYLSEGYAQVKVSPPQVGVSPDKKSADIIIRVQEGARFKVGKIEFNGEWPVSRPELFAANHLQKGQFFNYQIMQDDLKNIRSRCGNAGEPIPQTRIREADGEIDVAYELTRRP